MTKVVLWQSQDIKHLVVIVNTAGILRASSLFLRYEQGLAGLYIPGLYTVESADIIYHFAKVLFTAAVDFCELP